MPLGRLSIAIVLCLSGCASSTLQVEHLQTLGEAKLHHDALIFDLAVSPDGKTLLAASSVAWSGGPNSAGALALWNAESGERIRTLVEGDREVSRHGFFKSSSLGTHASSCAFSPSGKLIAAGLSSNEIRVWSAASGELVGSFPGSGPVRFRDEGRLVCGRSPTGGVVLEIDLESGETRPLYSLGDNLWALANAGDRVAAGSYDGHVHVWKPGVTPLVLEQSDTSSPVSNLSFRPNSQLLAASSKAGVELWDLETKVRVGVLPCAPLEVTALAWAPDGATLAYAVHGSTGDVSRGDPRRQAQRRRAGSGRGESSSRSRRRGLVPGLQK